MAAWVTSCCVVGLEAAVHQSVHGETAHERLRAGSSHTASRIFNTMTRFR